jgi:hypothetical protein
MVWARHFSSNNIPGDSFGTSHQLSTKMWTSQSCSWFRAFQKQACAQSSKAGKPLIKKGKMALSTDVGNPYLLLLI